MWCITGFYSWPTVISNSYNDLFKASSNLITVIFADDTNLFLSGKIIETLFQSMNTELEKSKVWLKTNKLSLKTSKTNFFFTPFLKENNSKT